MAAWEAGKARCAWYSCLVGAALPTAPILVVRVFGRLMNSDAIFSFSAIRVRFAQVGHGRQAGKCKAALPRTRRMLHCAALR
ncbi:hypothetical protein D3C72_2354960 [compost metagenome]